MSSPRAPRVFRTHRGGARWAAEQNPWPAGTQQHFEWLRDFWRDQATRGWARARAWTIVALICLGIALAAVLVRVLT